MARKSREEKVLEATEETTRDLEKLYDKNGRAVVEYINIVNEYKKLYKRFNKTIKMNDNVGKSVIVNNESLKGSLNYTIDAARQKLLHNVAEHRKTKEKLSSILDGQKNSSKNLKSQLELAYKRISELEKKVENLENGRGNITNVFEKRENSGSKIDINLDEFKKFSYKELLEKEIKKSQTNKTPLYLIKITVDNFDKIKEDIEEQGSSTSFLKGTVKFISVSIGKQSIVYYSHHNVFYIIYPKIELDKLKQKLDKLKVKRKLGENNITFSIGVVNYLEDDTYDSINKRCDETNEKAAIENLEATIEYSISELN